jgi:hypothetical protein
MFLALALLLIQPQVHAQMAFSGEKIALIEPVSSSLPAESASFMEVSLPLTSASLDISIQPSLVSESILLPEAAFAPEPAPVNGPALNAFLRTGKPVTVSVSQLRNEQRQKQRMWIGLGIAEHSAATFDAWTTRRDISRFGAQEMNPLLKPFAGNASLYAAIQVGPVVLDYLGKKMMYNRHGWVRHMWWVPQTASFTASLLCGVHNLGVH